MEIAAACFLVITAFEPHLAVKEGDDYVDAYTGEEIVTEGPLPSGAPLPVQIIELSGCGERKADEGDHDE